MTIFKNVNVRKKNKRPLVLNTSLSVCPLQLGVVLVTLIFISKGKLSMQEVEKEGGKTIISKKKYEMAIYNLQRIYILNRQITKLTELLSRPEHNSDKSGI